MANQPYIPLYIGDWEQDTNCLTPLAEFALLKLTFKLFKAEKRGVFCANFRTLSVLFKSNMDVTKEIFQELIDNKILNISEPETGKFEIISRRMTREATISQIRSEVGKQGGRGNKSKGKKQSKSKVKAKAKQNTDNDIDINIELFTNKVEFKNIFSRWLVYKRSRGESYKTDDSRGAALKNLVKLSNDDPKTAANIVEQSLANNWAGLFALKKDFVAPSDNIYIPSDNKKYEQTRKPNYNPVD